jgi:hypothetical protein
LRVARGLRHELERIFGVARRRRWLALRQVDTPGRRREAPIGKQHLGRQRVSQRGALQIFERDSVRREARLDEAALPVARAARELSPEADPLRQGLDDLEVCLDAGWRRHDGLAHADVAVAVGAEHVVFFEQSGGRQHHARDARRVGQEGIDHDRELEGRDRARTGAGVGQHGHRVACRHPQRAERRISQPAEGACKQRLDHAARRRGEAFDKAGRTPAGAESKTTRRRRGCRCYR